jgi:hypothetical protein
MNETHQDPYPQLSQGSRRSGDEIKELAEYMVRNPPLTPDGGTDLDRWADGIEEEMAEKRQSEVDAKMQHMEQVGDKAERDRILDKEAARVGRLHPDREREVEREMEPARARAEGRIDEQAGEEAEGEATAASAATEAAGLAEEPIADEANLEFDFDKALAALTGAEAADAESFEARGAEHEKNVADSLAGQRDERLSAEGQREQEFDKEMKATEGAAAGAADEEAGREASFDREMADQELREEALLQGGSDAESFLNKILANPEVRAKLLAEIKRRGDTSTFGRSVESARHNMATIPTE